MCKKYLWLKFSQVKEDIGQDIDKNNSTNQICSQFETDQSQNLAVLCVMWTLPSQQNARVLLGNCLGLYFGL